MRVPLAYLTGLLALLIGWSSGLPAADSAAPGINAPYLDPDYAQWVKVFERPGREVFDRRFQIVAALGLQRGMTVADVGAGTGLFTRLFARAVRPEGRVVAVDISRTFIDNILRVAAERGLDNVEGVVNDQRDSGLATASVDLVFLCDTYHHFEYPQDMLASIHAALRPGGTLAVVEYERILGVSPTWVLSHVRAGKGQVIEEIETAGFRLQDERKGVLREHYILRFVRPENEDEQGM